MGLEMRILNASTTQQIDATFAELTRQRPDGLLVGTDPFFTVQRERIVKLATELKIPAVYPFREFPASGGLISYGTSIANAFRQGGIYTGRVLKGSYPGDLPVMQPTTFELVINLKAVKALGIDIPPMLHARSDEVIE
jgi:ABC-type uncharacterized transport system substrate-binding protein